MSTTKQLTIVVQAVDQLTAPFLRMAQTMNQLIDKVVAPFQRLSSAATQAWSPISRIGDGVVALAGRVTAPFTKIIDSLTSIKTLVIGTVLALATGHLAGEFGDVAEKIGTIGKAAARYGLSTEFVSGLWYAADKAHTSFESLAGWVSTAEKNVGQFAVTGGGKAKAAFELLNVPLRDSVGRVRQMNELLPELADAIAGLHSASEKQFAVRAIFGDEGVLNLIGGGGGKIRTAMAEAARFGLVFSEQQTRADEEYTASVKRISAAWLGVKAAIVNEVAPVITPVLNAIADRIAQIPGTVRGLASQVGTFFGGQHPYAEEAGAKLAAFGGAAGSFLGTAALEAAKVFGVTVLEVLRAGIATLAPFVEDMLRDSVWPLVRQMAPTMKLLPEDIISPSLGAQLKDAKDRAASAVDGLAKLRELDTLRRGHDKYGSTPTPALDTSERLFREQLVRVNELQRQMAAQTAGRAADFRASWTEALGVVEVQAADAADKIADKWGGLIDARNAMLFVGPSEQPARERYNALAGIVKDWASAVTAQFSRVRGVLGSAVTGGGLGSILGSISNAQFAAGQRDSDLAARRLALSGDDRGAERLRLMMAQAEEMRKAQTEWVPAAIANLREYQALQAKSFDLGTDAGSAVKGLSEAEQAYSEGVKRRSDLVQAGTLVQRVATRENLDAAAALREQTDAVIAQVRAMQEANPELAGSLKIFLEQAEKVRKTISDVGGLLPAETFGDGFRAGLREFIAQYSDVYQQAKQLTVGIATTIGDGITNALTDVITGTKNVAEAFRSMATSVLSDISRMIIRMLVFRAISGVASSLLGGGSSAAGVFSGVGGAGGRGAEALLAGNTVLAARGYAFNAGNIVPFASGGVVGSPAFFGMSGGRTGLMGERGPEAIMPLARGADGKLGVRGGGGGVVINMSVTFNGGTSRGNTDPRLIEAVRNLPATLAEQLRRSPGGRSDVRAALS